MTLSLGIDLGTSAVKVALIGAGREIVASASLPIATERPRPLWSEQSPEGWIEAAVAAVDEVAAKAGGRMADVVTIGLSGQMHGLTLLDGADRPLRPAIIWNDGRAHEEAHRLEGLGPELVARIGVLPMAGFVAPKLLWLAGHEPAVLGRARRFLAPKDYIRLHLTGEYVTDPSDASGAWLLDATTRDWSPDVLEACGIDRAILPGIVEGTQVSGILRPELALRWGMPARVVVAGGAGDVAAGAIGIGAIEPGRAFASLGTSGQLFVAADRHLPAVATLVHAYCHGVPDRWFRMAAMLNGASPLAFAAGLLGVGDTDELMADVEASFARPSPILVLPYLAGERTPHNDPFANGVVFGLTGATTRMDVVQGFLEGVAFTFADAFDALGLAGEEPQQIGFIGGGARSRLWARMIASVLDVPLVRYAAGDIGPAVGAACLGFVAAGAGIGEICAPPVADVVEPDPALRDAYRPRIEAWRDLYRSLKPHFRVWQSKGDAP